MQESSAWLKLKDTVCVVTGAGSGIGAAIAQQLAAQGARVGLLDCNAQAVAQAAQDMRSHGAQALAVHCDVADRASVAAAQAQIHQALGPCGVLVNNAGLLRAGGLDRVEAADWQRVLDINLGGCLHCAQAFAPEMREAGVGSIVHVASIAGLFPQSGSGAYSASKAAVLQLSRQMAVEWGPSGVRSNAICPGMIRTPLSAKFYEEPGFEAKRAAVTASRRIGEPEDIAHVALFLASPRSGYLNGAELVVDGGMSCMLMDMVPRPGFNQTT